MERISIDYDQLRECCVSEEVWFAQFGQVHPLPNNQYYIYKNNGSNVLAVAHLDTRILPRQSKTFGTVDFDKAGVIERTTFNPQLDDRLGAYIILYLLPKFLGANAYDILLTTDEEVGQSTAEFFTLPEGKEYNWIFQFDRHGDDTVLYQYDDTGWRDVLREYFTIGQGSFSDIGRLDHLGVKAMNLGCGYHDEHQMMCYMIEEQTLKQVKAFLKFYRENKDTRFPHVKTAWRNGVWSKFEGADYWDNRWPNYTSVSSLASTKPKAKDLRQDLPRSSPSLWASLVDVIRYKIKTWVDDPADPDKKVCHSYTVYKHPTKDWQATVCKKCNNFINIEDVVWQDDEPYCDFCVEEDASYTTDQKAWMKEGGDLLQVEIDGELVWTRVPPAHLEGYASVCVQCNQYEWEDQMLFMELDGEKQGICRWCVDKNLEDRVKRLNAPPTEGD